MDLPTPPPIVHHAPGKLGLPPSARDRAVSALEGELTTEHKLPLQKGTESRIYLHPEMSKRGALIMLHGFTAGTWQFDLLARKAYEDGYDVYVPRLPGHGLKDANGIEDPSQLLTGQNWHDYEAFGDRVYLQVRDLGGNVGVLGLSVGANVALSIAERHAEVSKVVAYAPFLWPKEPRVQALFAVSHAADIITGHQASRLLNGLTYSWGEETRLDTLAGKRPGHSTFFGGNPYGATELGWKVIAEAPKLRGGLQIFSTAVDDAADRDAMRSLYARATGTTLRGWYEYPVAEGIPHPMVHPMEDKGRGQTPKLYEMTMDFLDRAEPANRGIEP
jgi:pimeloyl-ACP methyl ester carboxylesterase